MEPQIGNEPYGSRTGTNPAYDTQSRLAAYWTLVRPFTLLAPLLGGLAGGITALAYMNALAFDLGLFIPLLLGSGTLVVLNSASNIFNQIYDLEIDRVNKPYRPLPAGTISMRASYVACIALYTLCAIMALLVSWVFLLFVAAIAVFTILYSLPPIRLKNRLWVANLSLGFTRGIIGFVAAWSIYGNPLDPTPWAIGVIMCIFLIGASTTKDFHDIDGDRMFGARTLPVVYGIPKTVKYTTPFFILPFLLIPVGVGVGVLSMQTLILTGLVGWSGYVVFRLNKNAEEPSLRLENTPEWKHMYLLLIALQLGFCGAYIIS